MLVSPGFCLLGGVTLADGSLPFVHQAAEQLEAGPGGLCACGGPAWSAARPGGAALWPFRGHFSQQSGWLGQ